MCNTLDSEFRITRRRSFLLSNCSDPWPLPFKITQYMAKCNNADYSGTLVIARLEAELSRIEAFRELIKLHEEMIAGIGSVGLKLEKASAGKSKDSVPDLSKQLEAKQAEIANFYKGFVYFTLPMCSRLRSHTLRQAFLAMGSTQLAEACALRASALTFFKAMQCNPETFMTESCKKLELLALKPFDQAAVSYDGFGPYMQAPAPPAGIHGLFDAAITLNYAPLFVPVPAVPCTVSQGVGMPASPPPSAPGKSGGFSDSDSDSSAQTRPSETVFGAPRPSGSAAETIWN